MSTSIASSKRLAHAGRVTTMLELKSIGQCNFGLDVYAASESTDGLYIAAAVQDGLIYILRRSDTTGQLEACYWTIRTNYSFCRFVAIDDEAGFCLLQDADDKFHVFKRSINTWTEECTWACLFGFHYTSFEVALSSDGNILSWQFVSSINSTSYKLVRRKILWFPVWQLEELYPAIE